MSARGWIAIAAVLSAVSGLLTAALVPVGGSRSSAQTDQADGAAEVPVAEKPADDPKKDEEPLVVEEPAETPEGMAWIPGGTFIMGDREGAPDKDPEHLDDIPEHNDSLVEHEVALDGFWIDKTELTNAEFKRFVDATGYVTVAERKPKREDFAGQVADLSTIPEENLTPGSICFNSSFDPETLRKDHPLWPYQVWKYQKGANWRHPSGPESSLEGMMDHPVVHVAYEDAVAYCRWAGKQLPTEAQWEYAARGGLERKNYPWGDDPKPGDEWPHNIWQGEFPYKNSGGDGYDRTAPVGSFPANGYGLYDMTGNVWEWCRDWYRPDYYVHSPRRNPTGPKSGFDPLEPNVPKRVQRGGSFMCSDTYCIGYSVHSRMRGEPTSGAFHTGFRCVVTVDGLEDYRAAQERIRGNRDDDGA